MGKGHLDWPERATSLSPLPAALLCLTLRLHTPSARPQPQESRRSQAWWRCPRLKAPALQPRPRLGLSVVPASSLHPSWVVAKACLRWVQGLPGWMGHGCPLPRRGSQPRRNRKKRPFRIPRTSLPQLVPGGIGAGVVEPRTDVGLSLPADLG